MRPILATQRRGHPAGRAREDSTEGSSWGQRQGGPLPGRGTTASAFRLCPRGASTPLLRNCAPGPDHSQGSRKPFLVSLTYTSILPGQRLPGLLREQKVVVGLTSRRDDVTTHAARQRGNRTSLPPRAKSLAS